MTEPSLRFLRSHGVRLAALALVTTAYGFARLPQAGEPERRELAARFAFTRMPLAELPGREHQSVRPMHPSLRHISAWMSSVGAAVALHDLDGDGLANDLCHVDPRVDEAIVLPVPGTGERYPPFALDPRPQRLDRTMAPMGCLPGDFNEDGLADLVVVYWGRPPIAFLRRSAPSAAPGAAGYRPLGLAPEGERWFTNAVTSADVDGDGHLDLVVGNYFRDGAAILDERGTGVESINASLSRATNGGSNRVLLWRRAAAGEEPEVEFADLEEAFDPATRFAWTLAAGAADLDGDLLPEIYFSNDFGNDRLLHNRSRPGTPSFAAVEGERGFTDPASRVLGHDSFKGMGIDFADLNGDGMLDLYVSNIAQPWSLLESHFVWVSRGAAGRLRDGVAPYVDRGEELGLARSGWSWDARFADFDNDGVPEAVQAVGFVRGEVNRWPELHELAMGNDSNISDPRSWHHVWPGDDLSGHLHNPFFVRAADGRYVDVSAELGLDHQQVSRGIAVADVDGDGDLDFAVANQWQASYFYRNDSPRPGAFLALDLRLPAGAQGSGLSRPAVGAEAAVLLPDGRRLVAQVDGGSGHSGERAPLLHFGLGALPASESIDVDLRWRDPGGGARTGRLRLAPGSHRVRLGPGDPRVEAAPRAEG